MSIPTLILIRGDGIINGNFRGPLVVMIGKLADYSHRAHHEVYCIREGSCQGGRYGPSGPCKRP